MILFRCTWCGREFVPEMPVLPDCPKSELWNLHNVEMVTIEIPDNAAELAA